MIIIKPNDLADLKNIEKNLNYIFSYSDLAALGQYREVRVKLPKFIIENTINLKHTLEQVS